MKAPASFLLIWVCLSLSGFAQDQVDASTEKRSFDSLQKSLLFPGWGQLAEKKYLKGITFISAEMACLYGILANNHKGNKNYRLYKAAENVDDVVKYRGLTEKYDRRRNIFILAAVGVWAVNLIDIYTLVNKRNKKSENLQLRLDGGLKGLIGLTISFSF